MLDYSMDNKADTKLNLNRSVLLDQETDAMLRKLVKAVYGRTTSSVMRFAIRKMYWAEFGKKAPAQ